MFASAIVMFITAVAIWLHRQRTAPSLLYAGVFAQTILGLFAISILTRMAPVMTWCLPLSGTAQQDVHFVASSTTTNLLTAVSAIALFLGIPIILWIQERRGAMYYPRLTRWLIWPLLTGTLLFNMAALILIQTVTMTVAGGAFLNALQSGILILGVLSVPAIYLLALVSFLRRARERRR